MNGVDVGIGRTIDPDVTRVMTGPSEYGDYHRDFTAGYTDVVHYGTDAVRVRSYRQ